MGNPPNNISLLTIFKNPITYFITVVMIMAITGYHAFIMYMHSRPDASPPEQIFIIAGISAISLSVLVFTINDVWQMAALYAFLTFIITLYVFWIEIPLPTRIISPEVNGKIITTEITDFDLFSSDSIPYLPGFIFATVISCIEFYFSDLFYQYELIKEQERSVPKKIQPESDLSNSEHTLSAVERRLSELSKENEKLSEQLATAEASKEQSESKLSDMETHYVRKESHQEIEKLYYTSIDKLIEAKGILQAKPDSIRRSHQNWIKKKEAHYLDPIKRVDAEINIKMYQRAYELKTPQNV